MNKTTLFFALIVFLLSACAENYRIVSVTKVADTHDAIVYNLPKTAIVVQAEVEKTVSFKGPFSEYADTYFPSNKRVTRNETSYKLVSINVQTKAIPDSLHYYAILNPHKTVEGNFISLTEDLFPVGINTKVQHEIEIPAFDITLKSEEEPIPDYADLSIKSVRETVYDTVYTDVFRDSVFVKVPRVYARKQFKSPEKQAQEMAEQIFRLRDDRLALLKGVSDANNFPDGDAVKLMIKELNTYEKQYMSMFTGQSSHSSETLRFIYIPEKHQTTAPYTLFRFSPQFGILPAQVEQGEAIRLKIETKRTLHSVEVYEEYKTNKLKANKEEAFGFVHRIPAVAEISLFYKNQRIFRETMHLPQLGITSRIPAQLIKSPDIEILFYPELGSIKKISQP